MVVLAQTLSGDYVVMITVAYNNARPREWLRVRASSMDFARPDWPVPAFGHASYRAYPTILCWLQLATAGYSLSVASVLVNASMNQSTSSSLNTSGGRSFKMLPYRPHTEVSTWLPRRVSRISSAAC